MSHPTPTRPHHADSAWIDLADDHQQTKAHGHASRVPQPMPRLPGYVIERELGRGGMGVVYLAWHLALGRHVAIKMMLAGPHVAADGVSRFQAEIRAVARLHHPNVVQIHDVDFYDGLPFCALEYLDGGSLARRLDGMPVPERRAAELLAVLARAVQAAHEAGIVHRDLKPGNVLFASTDWNPRDTRITDFGVAKSLGGGGVTATDSVIGTPAYMAPEQADGHSRDVGPAADVYSLGAILYECLTGRPPFIGTNALEILPRVLTLDPVPPSRLVGVARDLETICLKCLRKEPAARYASAAELADDVERYLAGQPISARPRGRAEKAWRWCRRNPAVAGLLTALAVVAVAAFVGVTWQWRSAVAARYEKEHEATRANEERLAKQTEAAAAQSARQTADVERDNAEAHLAQSRVAQAHLLWERHGVAKARELLAACPVERRGWEWHYLNGLCRCYLASAETAGWALRVAVSPDGHTAVVAQGYPFGNQPVVSLRAYALPDLSLCGQPRQGLAHPLRHFSFAADGRLATIDGLNVVRILERDTLAVTWKQSPPAGTYGGWLSPDARRLVRARADHRLRVWDVIAGKELPPLAGHEHPVRAVAFSPDGDAIASADERGTVCTWDARTGKQRARLPESGHGIAISPDGKWLATNYHNAAFCVFDLTTGARAWHDGSLQRPNDLTGEPVFSPDGRWLVCNSVASAPRVWEAATGKGGHFLRGHEGAVHAVTRLTFSPDGAWVCTTGTDRTVRLWDPASGEQVRLYRGHLAGILDGAFAADGRQIVTVSGGPNDGANRVIVWDRTKDQRVSRQETFTRYWPRGELLSLLAYRLDGRLLVGYAGYGINAFDEAGVQREQWGVVTSQDEWREWHGMDVSADGRFLVGKQAADRKITRLDLTTRQTLTWDVGEPVRTVAVNSDGRLIAAGTRAGRVIVWDAKTQKVIVRRDAGPLLRLAFSPDGRRVGVAGRGLSWVDVESGELRPLATDVKGAVVGLAWKPDGSALACTLIGPGEVRIYDADGALTRRWPEPRILGDVVYHPDGTRIAVASREGLVTLYDPRTGREVLTLKGLIGRMDDVAFPPRLAFSRDGRRLTANDYRTGFWTWHANATPAEHRQRAEASAFDFHVQAAAYAQEMDRRTEFRFHLARVRRLTPPSGRPLLERAALLARAEDWSGAAADYGRWFAALPESCWLNEWPELCERRAYALWLAGDREACQKLCDALARTKPTRREAETALTRVRAVCGRGEAARLVENPDDRGHVSNPHLERWLFSRCLHERANAEK